VGFPLVHAEGLQDLSDLIQTVGNTEVRLGQTLCFDGHSVTFPPQHLKRFSFMVPEPAATSRPPAYTKDLRNIMLEAMVCGTPVLATPVGATSDVIIDGKIGSIMKNKSPECIAVNVIRVPNPSAWKRLGKPGGGLWRRTLRLREPWKTGRKFFRALSSYV
jgi:hypothetical protein